jgi:hypothetical protein
MLFNYRNNMKEKDSDHIYSKLSDIRNIKYMGSRGDRCDTYMDCHNQMSCVTTNNDNKVCGDWKPLLKTQLDKLKIKKSVSFKTPINPIHTIESLSYLPVTYINEDLPIKSILKKSLDTKNQLIYTSQNQNYGKNYY